MKTAVLAIDATRDTPQAIGNLSRGVIRFQKAGFFEEVHIASVVHPDSFLQPYSFFRSEKYELGRQAKDALIQKLHPELKVSSTEMLVTEAQSMNDHIELLNHFATAVGANVLVLGTNEKSTLSYLMQGSFAEAVSLKSALPSLVFGRASGYTRTRQPRTMIVALSPSMPPSRATRKWIVKLALGLQANICLLPVEDQSRWLSAGQDFSHESAEHIRREFAMEGILSVNILTRDPVLSGQVAAIADQKQALLTILCSTPNMLKKPMLAPSVNGRVISEMSRPILVIKENKSHDPVTLAKRPVALRGAQKER